jgi:hypothetical protein
MSADEDWARTASHWKVTLTRKMARTRLTTYFSMGSAHTSEPGAADVLNSLALDSSSYDNASGFLDWARDLGMEWDSSCEGMSKAKAEDYGMDCSAYFAAKKTYATVEVQREKLYEFLGAALYKELLYETEGL